MIHKNMKMLKMAFAFAPKWVIFTFLQNIFTAISTVLSSVMVVQAVYNGIIGYSSFSKVAMEIVLVSLFIIANCVINSVYYGKTFELGMQQISDHVTRLINDQTSQIDIALFQNSEFLKLHSLISETFADHLIKIVNYSAFYVANLLAIILCIAISATISFRIILCGCSFIPLLILISNRKKRYVREKSTKHAAYRKQKEYCSGVFSDKEYVEEIRLYPLLDLFKHQMSTISDSLQKAIKTLNGKLFFMDFAEQGILNIVIYWGITYCLSVSILEKVYPISYLLPTVAVAFQLINRVHRIVDIGPHFKNFAEYFDYYTKFMQTSTVVESRKGIELAEPIKEIIIEDLSFRYKNGGEIILSDINMVIKKGQKIGLVGENGAGKTTLIRILLGLYDHYTGHIYVNGIDLRDIDKQSYRSRISHILQKFNIYACSLNENVALGEDHINEVVVQEALTASTLCDDLADSNPMMTKVFHQDGVELSGGQKQKLVIARGLYRKLGILFLDEPSSALDPLSEKNIFNNINVCTADDILFVISHRLYTIRNVDWIYYMENGRIIEQGNHESLMVQKGKYEKMYTLQMERFGESLDE